MNEDDKAILIKEEAVKVARDLIDHAKETARQMLLGTSLDTSKIPLICDRVGKIELRLTTMDSNMVWITRLCLAIAGGIGTLVIIYLSR